jgi:hypothetical protein
MALTLIVMCWLGLYRRRGVDNMKLKHYNGKTILGIFWDRDGERVLLTENPDNFKGCLEWCKQNGITPHIVYDDGFPDFTKCLEV